jgi:TolB protein
MPTHDTVSNLRAHEFGRRNGRSDRSFVLLGCALLALAGLCTWLQPAAAQSDDAPLPGRMVIDVNAPERALYRIAVPNLLGGGGAAIEGAGVLRNDLTLSSLFQVLDPRSFIAPESEGLTVQKSAWSNVGAQGIIKGQLTQSGSSITVEMRLFELARGEAPLFSKTYRGDVSGLRGMMHDFANEVLRILTGKAGVFGSHLTYARKVGPGRKDIYISDFDGHSELRASSGKGNAMLPSFGQNGGVWYSKLTDMGSYITNTKSREQPVIRSSGLNIGPVICSGRVYFSSSRDGNSEIYSAALDGSDPRRLTRDPGIDVSPTCGPNGKIAFVSSRHGGPQIFVMNGDGSGVQRVTYKGNHNQTPSFCQDPENPLIAFSARDGGGFDIVTVNLKTGEYKRLTQGQGVNQDPTFSPDCRMVAFVSSRGGVFVSNPDGLNQIKILNGNVSTVRWGR